MGVFDFLSADNEGGGLKGAALDEQKLAFSLGVSLDEYRMLPKIDNSSPEAYAASKAAFDRAKQSLDQQKAVAAANKADPTALGGTGGYQSSLMSQWGANSAQDYGDITRAADEWRDVGTKYGNAADALGMSYGVLARDVQNRTGIGAMSTEETGAIGTQSEAQKRLMQLATAQEGPSVAEMQLQSGFDQSAAQGMSLAASQRGGSSAAGMMAALAAGSAGGQSLAQQQAILRAQEAEQFRKFQADAAQAGAQIGSQQQANEAARRAAQIAQYMAAQEAKGGQQQTAYNTRSGALGGYAQLTDTAADNRSGYNQMTGNVLSEQARLRMGDVSGVRSTSESARQFNEQQDMAKTAAGMQLAGSGLAALGEYAQKENG